MGELIGDVADLDSDPRRDQREARDGRGGGVDEERELLAADAKAIGDRTHRGTDQERVGVVIEEHEQSEEPGRELSAAAARCIGAHPRSEALGATALRHQAEHPAEQQAEDQDRRVSAIGDRVDDVRVEQAGERSHERQVRNQKRAEPDPEDQRHQHVTETATRGAIARSGGKIDAQGGSSLSSAPSATSTAAPGVIFNEIS